MHMSVGNSLKYGLEAKSKGFFKEKCCVITQSLIVGAPPFVIIITIFIE